MNGFDISRRFDLLIVEDRPVMRVMLREFVQNAFPDCEIFDVANGTRAMERCAEHTPDLVLMDVCLPDANGIELTARIRAQWPGVQVIVVSYLSAEAYIHGAKSAGAYTYIVKDRLTQDLIPAIESARGIAPSGPAGKR
jgi:DNA-binding NarL/FixJ family response regulator